MTSRIRIITRSLFLAGLFMLLDCLTGSSSAQIVLNEVLAANTGSVIGPSGNSPDYVEVFNTSSSALSLTGWTITDSPSAPAKFAFPAGGTIPGKGFIVIWLDSLTNDAGFHAVFSLKSSGEQVVLYHNGVVADSITFGPQVNDLPLCRIPNGSGTWQLGLPTAGSSNLATTLGPAAELRINEWLPTNSLGANFDMLEIYNRSTNPVSLGGVVLTDGTLVPTTAAIPTNSFIGPQGFQAFICDKNPAAGANHLDFRLSSSAGETISLYGEDRVTLIDRISFTTFTNLPAEGRDIGMGRLPDGGTNIVFFKTNFTSLGGPNKYLPITNVVISEILSHTDPPLEDALELQNIGGAGADLSGWWLSNTENSPEKFRIPSGTIITAGGFKVFYEQNQLNAASATPGFNRSGTGNAPDFTLNSAHGDFTVLTAFLPDPALGGLPVGYQVSKSFGAAKNGVSFGRYVKSDGGTDTVPMSGRSFGIENPATVAEFRLGTGAANSYPSVGPLIISEIMFHPPGIGTNNNTLDEFIELTSVTNGPVKLFFYDPLKPAGYQTNTWRILGGVGFDFPTNVVLPAFGRLLLVNFDPLTNITQLAAFRLLYGVSNDVPIFGPYSGALNNQLDTIELQQPDYPQEPPHPDAGFVPYVLVEKVKYEATLPWPTNASATGLSLQRFSSQGYGNDQTNWFAALPSAGRTNDTSAYFDSDGDGLPDAWEVQYFGSISDPRATPTADPDSDGLTNLQEYLAGTVPTNAASNLKFHSISMAGGTITLGFTTAAGRTYSVIYRNDFVAIGPWLKLTNVPVQIPGFFTIQDSTMSGYSARFYRLVTPAQP